MTEQLALDQLGGEAGAVQIDEGARSMRAPMAWMARASIDLAGTRLPEDEDRDVRVAQPLHLIEQLAHRR